MAPKVKPNKVVFQADWKLAANKLKIAVADLSIDRYFQREYIQTLRQRFNDKERTQELYEAIMRL